MIELSSKTIRFRLAEETDAEFILSLRLDAKYNRFLSKVENNIECQRNWLRKYKSEQRDGKQFYFIIERLDGCPCGTVRVYDLTDDSFCWGSWILNENKTTFAAIESALLVYKFGFDHLGYSKSHFEVSKGNEKVVRIHKKFGAEQVGEDENSYKFIISAESIRKFREKFPGY